MESDISGSLNQPELKISQFFRLADTLNLCQNEHNSELVKDWGILVSLGLLI